MSLSTFFLIAQWILDGFLVALSFWAAFTVRFHSGWLSVGYLPPWEPYLIFAGIVVGAHGIVFKYAGLYRQRRGISGVDEFSRIFLGTSTASVLVAASTFLIRSFSFSRLVIVFTWVLAPVAVWAGRTMLRRIQVDLRRKGKGITRLLVVGTGETACIVLQRLRSTPGLGYQVVGVVSERSGKREVEGVRVVGILSHLVNLIARHRVEEVLFALPASAHAQLIPQLVRLQGSEVKYKIVSDLFGIITNPMETDVLLGMPVFEMKEAPLNGRWNRILKRVFDLFFSGAALVFLTLTLVFPLLALGVKLSSPGPVFFRQKRVGRDGKPFVMLKFRSMAVGSETVAFTRKNDPRRTPFGIMLRRTSLDELPQLINVLKGEMSLVGPRPEVPGLVERFGKEIPRYFERHRVKSGITGWAQVNGFRGNTSLRERVSYDIYYIENWSPWLDVKIILRTVLDLFEHRHAY